MNEATGQPIVCLGDSITQGFGMMREQAFPSILGNILHQPVINAGRDGDMIAGALARLETDVLRLKPKLVTVELGANDYLEGISEELAWNDLELIVGKIKESGAEVVLLSMGPEFWGDDWEQAVERIAVHRDCGYMPGMLEGIVDNPVLLLDDVHPNVSGYILIARRVAEYLVHSGLVEAP